MPNPEACQQCSQRYIDEGEDQQLNCRSILWSAAFDVYGSAIGLDLEDTSCRFPDYFEDQCPIARYSKGETTPQQTRQRLHALNTPGMKQ